MAEKEMCAMCGNEVIGDDSGAFCSTKCGVDAIADGRPFALYRCIFDDFPPALNGVRASSLDSMTREDRVRVLTEMGALGETGGGE